jgi:MYXO-CTERM domain-containing protein
MLAMVSAVAGIGLAGGRAMGQVDGTKGAGEYGAPLATQTAKTGFGDTYSQLDAIYAKVLADGSVRILIAGNMNNSGEGLVNLIDNGRGGGLASVDPVTGAGQAKDWRGRYTNHLGAWNGAATGSIFAPGFNPRLAMATNLFADNYYSDMVELFKGSGDGSADYYLNPGATTPVYKPKGGTGTAASYTLNYNYYNTGQGSNDSNVTVAFDNSNTATFPSSPLSNTTGFEAEFTPAFLRVKPGTSLKLLPLVQGNGNPADYISNQFLPGLPSGTGNLATGVNGRLFDWNTFQQTTFITIQPPTNATGATWFSDGDWTYGSSPNGINTQAAFPSGTSARSIGINGNPVIGTLYLSGTGGNTFNDSNSGGSDLTFKTFFGDNAAVSVSDAGTHTINVPVKLNTPVDVSIAAGATLALGRVQAVTTDGLVGINVSGGGTVKLNGTYTAGNIAIANSAGVYQGLVQVGSNVEVVTRTSDTESLRLAAKAFLDSNGASGLGIAGLPAGQAMAIFSNNVDGTNGYYTTYDGLAVTAGDVILRRAYKGDVNLDGVVNGKDIKAIFEAAVFGLTGWNNGDSNYDGVVDQFDISAALANEGLAPLFGSPASVDGGTSSIPEPGALGLLGVAAVFAGRRRR